MKKIRITVWNEYWDETRFENVRLIYPDGMHTAIKGFLDKQPDFEVRVSTPDDKDFGLSQELLDETDVLVWWGHVIHHLVPDSASERVCARVREGMGFIALHSSIYSKPFSSLVGPIVNCAYREDGEKERVWTVNAAHEISFGLPACFEIEHTEVYREPTGLPLPDELVFVSWYAGGEIGISGGCYYRGLGRIFSFTPGHEDYPVFYNEYVQKVIVNAARWAFSPKRDLRLESGEVAPYEKLDSDKLIFVHKDR